MRSLSIAATGMLAQQTNVEVISNNIANMNTVGYKRTSSQFASIVANADALAKKKAVIERFMQAYRESIDYMYSDNPQVIKDYAEFVGIPESLAKRTRDEFFPKSLINPDKIEGLDSLSAEAVTLKFIPAPLTAEQTKELIQIVPRK